MIIIVDGYNVLKQFFSGHINDSQRREFIAHLSSYARYKKHTIIIVFDGYSNDSQVGAKRVQVIYAGSYGTADDSIKDFLDRYSMQDTLLVTDDTMLNRYASDLHVVSIGGRDFYRYIKHALSYSAKKTNNSDQMIKTSQHTNPALDELLYASSNQISDKETYNTECIRKNEKTMSKIERLLLKKLAKL